VKDEALMEEPYGDALMERLTGEAILKRELFNCRISATSLGLWPRLV